MVIIFEIAHHDNGARLLLISPARAPIWPSCPAQAGHPTI
jgi:hypothetical protein